MGCFGLSDDYGNPYQFPLDLLVEANPRLDVWHLLQCGALVEGVETQVKLAGNAYLLARRAPNILVDGTPIAVVWDEPMAGVGRPWFECPVCARRCRHVYLRDVTACRRCHRLDNASRHLRRQTPGVGRVERLRRKLGGCDIRPFAPLPPLRRGRSREYHERLVGLIHEEEAKLIGQLGGVVHDLRRRILIRKSRGKW